VVFAAAVEVFEAKLVLDRQNESTVFLQKGLSMLQAGLDRIVRVDEFCGVFKNANERDIVEFVG
jgi:hypothetical protein